MIGQVQIVNGQKVIVALSDETPVDIVQSGNAHPVTSNAVANHIPTKSKKVVDSYDNTKEITITYAKSGQTSTSWLASWNGYELGAIQPIKITAGHIPTSQPDSTNGAIWVS